MTGKIGKDFLQALFDLCRRYPHKLQVTSENRLAPQRCSCFGKLLRGGKIVLEQGDFTDDFNHYTVIITKVTMNMMVKRNCQSIFEGDFPGKFHQVVQDLSLAAIRFH